MMNRLIVLSVAALASACLFAAYGAEKEKKPIKIDASKLPPAAAKQGVTYATDIKPIFDNSCTKCHGEQKPKAHLRLDSLEGVLKGGEDGKVVAAGDATGSLLMANVAHLGDPDDYMPPPKNKAGIGPLTSQQIGLIRAWIEQGAK